MAITDFLLTTIDRPQLEAALKVLRAFKDSESQEEWLAIPFGAWAKLEQLEEFLDHLVEGKPLKQDTLDYMAQHPPSVPAPPSPANRTISDVTEAYIFAADEADARISELERALKSCSTVLSQMLKKDEALAGVAREALAEADRALVVSDGNPHAEK